MQMQGRIDELYSESSNKDYKVERFKNSYQMKNKPSFETQSQV